MVPWYSKTIKWLYYSTEIDVGYHGFCVVLWHFQEYHGATLVHVNNYNGSTMKNMSKYHDVHVEHTTVHV